MLKLSCPIFKATGLRSFFAQTIYFIKKLKRIAMERGEEMIVRNPEYFFMVAKEQSISKAAKKLFVSEPYLSQYITKLEKEANIKLLDRSVTPFVLTQAGKLLYEHLERVQGLEKILEASFQTLQHQKSKTLNIGTSSGRGSVLLPNLLEPFLAKFPNINIVMHEHPSDELSMLVREGVCDFALYHRCGMEEDIVYEPLLEEKILLCGPANHPLTLQYPSDIHHLKPFDLRLLQNERFVLPRPDQALAKIVQNIFAQYNLKVSQEIITSNSTTALNLVAKGYGFVFLPETDIRRSKVLDQLVCYTVNDPPLSFPLVVAYKKSASLFPVAREFIDLVVNYYKKV